MKLDLGKKEEVERLFDRLYPLCRSITGKGLRQSLSLLEEAIPLERLSFPSGARALNWTVPQEWDIREAHIRDERGCTVVDFKDCNLHVVNYSSPVDRTVTLDELKEHVYTCPGLPGAVPYVISYYQQRWGFCMSQNKLSSLPEGNYRVYIDSSFRDGELNVGHAILPGEEKREILLSSYLCHPSMANNELSGPLVLAMLYQRLERWPRRRFTYRFVLNPETIGSICYLSRFGTQLKHSLYGGLVLTCLGGKSDLRYKQTYAGNGPIDRLCAHLNRTGEMQIRIFPYSPLSGSDERQYNSPGFRLPVGQMARMAYGEYPQYHTSLDTKEIMGIENIMESADRIERLLLANEREGRYLNQFPYGEVKLGDYNLYSSLNAGGNRNAASCTIPGFTEALLMILNDADGEHRLSDTGNALGKSIPALVPALDALLTRGLVKGPYSDGEELTLPPFLKEGE